MPGDDAPPSHAPGPSGLRFLLDAPGTLSDPLGWLLQVTREYGDVVSLSPHLRRIYLVTHPTHVKHVLLDNADGYKKADLTTDRFRPFFGESVVISEGEQWRRQRRLMLPAFHRQRLAEMMPLMVGATEEMLQGWRAGDTIQVGDTMKRLTLSAVSRSLLGRDVGGSADVIAEAIETGQEYISRRMFSVTGLTDRWLAFQQRDLRRAVAAVNAVVIRLIDERREDAGARGDLLSALLTARDPDTGEGMGDPEICDQLKGILVAGYESTATALTWTWHFLSQNPGVRARMEAEVKTVLGDRPPTPADLPQLIYTRMVFDESMRLYPPLWVTLRTPLRDDRIDGRHIPAGSLVLLSPYVTHRRPDLWDRPDSFDPERFASERSAARPRFAFFPFGGGPRGCLGAGFAMMEAQVILAMIAQRFRLEALPGHAVQTRPKLTLQPRKDFFMTLRDVT